MTSTFPWSITIVQRKALPFRLARAEVGYTATSVNNFHLSPLGKANFLFFTS